MVIIYWLSRAATPILWYQYNVLAASSALSSALHRQNGCRIVDKI
jgi:hypothetical protein